MINLYFDDCASALDNIAPNTVDLVAIDPPYGIDTLNSKWDHQKINKLINLSEKKSCTVKKIPVGMKFDPNDAILLEKFLNPIAVKLNNVLKPGGFCLVFSQSRASHRVALAFENASFEVRDQLIWDYGAGQGKAQGLQNFIKKNKNFSSDEKEGLIKKLENLKTPQLTPTFETIWLFQKKKEGTFLENYLKHKTGLVDFSDGSKKVKFEHSKPKVEERKGAGMHPTLKPVSLMKDLIKIFCPENGIVLDCFMGSGTTGVAAIELKRSFIGVEKEKEYFQIAEERIKKLQQVS